MRSSVAIRPVTPAPISPELRPEWLWSGEPDIIILPTSIRDRYQFTALITRLTVCRRSTTRMPAPTLWVATHTAHTVLPAALRGTTRRPALTGGSIPNNIPTAEERARVVIILPPIPRGPLSKGAATMRNGGRPPSRAVIQQFKPVTL